MMIIHEKHTARPDPGYETHNLCADQLRSFPVSISQIHADGDRGPASPIGRSAAIREEATIHAGGSNSLALDLPDLARLEEIPYARTARNRTCLATEKVPGALDETQPERQTGSPTGIQGDPRSHP